METLSYHQLMERCLAAEARVVELAAENVALKESRNNLAEFIHEELYADYALNMNLETPATDRIVAGIKADGLEEFAAYQRAIAEEWACKEGHSSLLKVAESAELFAKHLREEADK